MTEPNRERLGHAIESRRKAMGLSLSAAARLAGVDRATWTGSERGTRQTETYNYASIERALKWVPGSVETVLAGGDPIELPQPDSGRPRVDLARIPPDFNLHVELARARALDIPPHTRALLIRTLMDIEEQLQAQRERAGSAAGDPIS